MTRLERNIAAAPLCMNQVSDFGVRSSASNGTARRNARTKGFGVSTTCTIRDPHLRYLFYRPACPIDCQLSSRHRPGEDTALLRYAHRGASCPLTVGTGSSRANRYGEPKMARIDNYLRPSDLPLMRSIKVVLPARKARPAGGQAHRIRRGVRTLEGKDIHASTSSAGTSLTAAMMFERRRNGANSRSCAAESPRRLTWRRRRVAGIVRGRFRSNGRDVVSVDMCGVDLWSSSTRCGELVIAGSASFYEHSLMSPIGMLHAFMSEGRTTLIQKPQYVLSLSIAAALTAAGADDTAARLEKATAVLNKMTQSGHDIPAGRLASADCVVVIPGFKKGAIVVGVGHGRGFISCRNAGNWSAPGAIALR